MRYLYRAEKTQKEWLETISNSKYFEYSVDVYNEGELIDIIENRFKVLTGKADAAFFPKGVTAQQAALLVWSEHSKSKNVLLHPQSHIYQDEFQAVSMLSGLDMIPCGLKYRASLKKDFLNARSFCGAISLEIPLRKAGFIAPDLNEIVNIFHHADSSGIPLHLDGARFFECLPYYGHSSVEMCSYFDSIYFSLYKMPGGMGGSILVGTEEFIKKCKLWRTRFGGDLYTAFPYIVTSLEGLDKELPRLLEYHKRACEIAAVLSRFSGISIFPGTLVSNYFRVYIRGKFELINKAFNEITSRKKINLGTGFHPNEVDTESWAEFCIGSGHKEISTQEIEEVVSYIRDKAA